MCGVAWGSVVELMVLRRAVRGVWLCQGVCVYGEGGECSKCGEAVG